MNWNDEAQKWIDLARDGHDPSASDTRRVRRALIERCIAAGSVATAGAAASTSTATAASAITVKALFVNASVALVVAGSVATAAGVWFESTSMAPASSASAASRNHPRATSAARGSSTPRAEAEAALESASQLPVAAAAEAPMQTARALPTAVVVAGERSSSAPPAEPAAHAANGPAAPTRALEREIAGLRSAQQALNRGEADSAQRALDRLERTNPEGALLEERLATRAVLACTSGADTAALNEFVERYPASVHLSRVRAACRGEKQSVGRFPETGPAREEH